MKIMGHRGARFEFPENTLLSIEHALDCGVDGVEIDIHASADGDLMVIHDSTLERTTNLTGLVSESESQSLRLADAGQAQSIPFLEEVMELVVNRGKSLFVEVKGAGVEQELLGLLRDSAFSSQIILKCFHHRWLFEFGQLLPNIKKAALMYGVPADPCAVAQSAGAQMLSLNAQTVDKTCVEQAHAGGVEVCVWNINETNLLKDYHQMGVDWLATDCPRQIVPAWHHLRSTQL